MRPLFTFALASLLLAAFSGNAAEPYTITIKDHAFSPANLTIPANEKVKITVDNKDATAEEFESHELKREKVVAGNSQITLFVGPLEPGTYKYYGEFHEKTAQGTITAK